MMLGSQFSAGNGRVWWFALAAPLAFFSAGACGGVVDHESSSDQSVYQPDDETGDAGESGGSLGDAARRDVQASSSAACEAFTTQVCRLRMRCWECPGSIDTTLEVRRVGERRLSVTDGPGSGSPWEVLVDVGLDGTLDTDAGVPSLTCEQLIENYGDESGPDTYGQVEGYPCSDADAALIRFFVREWFYFG